MIIPSKNQWRKWSLPSKLTAIGTGLGLLGIFISIALYLVPKQEPEINILEDLAITNVSLKIDHFTYIYNFVDVRDGTTVKTGLISVYWELMLSNNGIHDLSINKYRLIKLPAQNPAIDYTHMDQGLYLFKEGALAPLKFPLIISAGYTISVFLKVGVIMGDSAYYSVKDNFTDNKKVKLYEIVDFLREEKHIDIFDNLFTVDPILDTLKIFTLPPLDEINEQIFGIVFQTSRGNTAIEAVSWYKYGLYRQATQ